MLIFYTTYWPGLAATVDGQPLTVSDVDGTLLTGAATGGGAAGFDAGRLGIIAGEEFVSMADRGYL